MTARRLLDRDSYELEIETKNETNANTLVADLQKYRKFGVGVEGMKTKQNAKRRRSVVAYPFCSQAHRGNAPSTLDPIAGPPDVF